MKHKNPQKVAGRRELPRLGGRATQRHNQRRSRNTVKQQWKREVLSGV